MPVMESTPDTLSDRPQVTLTYVGTATALIEVDGLRLLTDPAFDDAGTVDALGKTGRVTYRSTLPAALGPHDVMPVDAVLLSHAQHKDNLDHSGREALNDAPLVLTTTQSANALATSLGDKVRGMQPWDACFLVGKSGTRLRITAVPARHGPRFTTPVTGHVTGFVIDWPERPIPAIYFTGDTRLFSGVRQVFKRFSVGLVLANLGGVQFGPTRGMRFSMTAEEATRMLALSNASYLVPLHYEGWTHFQEGKTQASATFRSLGLDNKVLWLSRGEPTPIYL